MIGKKRLYTFAILNILLLFGGVLLFVVLHTRELPPQGLSPENRRELIEKITSVDKLRGMALRDDNYIRALESWISSIRIILLWSSAVVGAFALTNLVLIPWRRQKDGNRDNRV